MEQTKQQITNIQNHPSPKNAAALDPMSESLCPDHTISPPRTAAAAESFAYDKSTAQASVAPGNPYTARQPVSVRKPDTAFTKKLKEQFPFFGIGSLLYALFYTFCLYRNTSGITYPFFVAGTLCYFFCSMRRLGVPYKKSSLFYLVSMVLLGISNCLTNSAPLLLLNKCGIFLLAFILMLHTMYQDSGWNLPKYFTALFQTIGAVFCCLLRPFGDMVSYFDAQKQAKTGKKSNFLPVMAGVLIAIPTLLIVTMLLASADVVFADLFSRVLKSINFVTVFGILFMMTAVFFCSYAVYAALCMQNVREELTDYRRQNPIVAIIVTAALSVVYLLFSGIQILYLFIGKMQLPAGYTYSSYAREGFFQLLAVCILNLVIVLISLYLFRESVVLKGILTVISGCTFIMILSSALRMLMYIRRYNLTLLRILVLWALAVIFLLMAGVTVFIYRNSFPLFPYGMAVVTVFYIGLSFAHPDYWIARYNLQPEHLGYLNDYDVLDSREYLTSLSADAAPVLLDRARNGYITADRESIGQNGSSDSSGIDMDYEDAIIYYKDATVYLNREEEAAAEPSWLRLYYLKIQALSENMHIRNYNFSIGAARKYLEVF